MSEVRYIKLPGSSSASEIIVCHKMEEGWKRGMEKRNGKGIQNKMGIESIIVILKVILSSQ